jgi:hypothetical protein
MARGGLEARVSQLRMERLKKLGQAVPNAYRGVTKEKIGRVLAYVHLDGVDLIDGVFALMDDETPSWFSNAPEGASLSDGATTAHLATHIGILQRGGSKLDREGRDYWIKPLRELGGIEPILLYDGAFIAGHNIANSPNSSYRLSEDLKAVLRAPEDQWRKLMQAWADDNTVRKRREFQAMAEEAAKLMVATGHGALIQASIEQYASHFLPGYEVVRTDQGNGDRVTDADREALTRAGLVLVRGDAMPDVLLLNPETDHLWVIEAVTSDGEVDIHKVTQMEAFATRNRKAGVGFTTTYKTWKSAAARQGAHGNIAVGTYVWIQADPARHMLVQSFV